MALLALFTHISLQDKTQCYEVMPYLSYVGQVFGLEVHGVPFTFKFPLTLLVGQHPKDLRIVGMLMEPITDLKVN